MKLMKYIKSICYSGFRENQHPGWEIYPSYEEIREDLHILVRDGYRQIRVYDPNVHAIRAIEIIREDKLPLKVMLGLGLGGEEYNEHVGWGLPIPQHELDKNIPKNEAVLRKVIELANKYPDVINYVSAGNENTSDWNPNLISVEKMAYYIDELKKHTKQKVTFCEGVFFWNNKCNALAEHVDFLSIHVYPFWTKTPFEEAVAETIKEYNQTKENFPNKPIIITELGWPTSSTVDNHYTNLENHAAYIKGIDEWAKKENVLVYYFEAFDEPWKGGNNPIEAEKHWGLYDVERKNKTNAI